VPPDAGDLLELREFLDAGAGLFRKVVERSGRVDAALDKRDDPRRGKAGSDDTQAREHAGELAARGLYLGHRALDLVERLFGGVLGSNPEF
jgi:hypothetical protein